MPTQAAGRPRLVYGHFDRRRGFGIDAHAPEVTPFVTVLPDPFERPVTSAIFAGTSR